MIKKNSTAFRIFAGIVTLAAIIWGYWWLAWILALVFLFAFPLYYEIIAWGIIYDALYGVSLPEFYGFAYVFTAAGVILFLVVFFLRKYFVATYNE